MAVVVPDRLSHDRVAGFRDRLGEREVLPQSSGVLLDYLYFADPLASAPFFAQGLKERVARLSSFSHSSYCRIRKVQKPTDADGRTALVSIHVPGRRMAEILEASAWAELRPQTSAVMGAARQVMAAASLLHDFAPDAFHGALGPERLVVAAEGRIVVSEHVLGTLITEAADQWGAGRVWRELGVATMTDPALARDGRRHDVVQAGLVVLALLLGRPIAPHEYPDELRWLLQQATETEPEGSRVPLGAGLQEWLERTLGLADERSYTTLVDAQRALAELMQDARYSASTASWSAFVAAGESALQRMPAPGARREEPLDVPLVAPQAVVAEEAASTQVGDGSAGDLLATWTPEPAPAVSKPVERVPSEPLRLEAVPLPPEPVRPVMPPLPTAPIAVTPPPARPPKPGTAPQPMLDADLIMRGSAKSWEPDAEPDELEADVPAPEAVAGPARNWSRSLYAYVRPAVILAMLVAVAAAAFVYAPRVWALVFNDERATGQLIIDSEPIGSAVSVDGQFRGVTPLTVPLRAGSHRLDVQYGGTLQSKTIQIEARKRVAERLTFPGVQDRGGLSITTVPPAGRVTIDGAARGTAPISVADLTPGSHVVVIETPLGSQTQDVTVEAGKLLQVTIQTVSWVKVAAPYDLEVSEDGRFIGTTGKATVVLSPGHHRLEFANAALGLKLRQSVDTEPGKLLTVPVELPMGTMNLTSDQPAEVSIDGQVVGNTPIAGVTVSLGRHEVAFQHPKLGRLVYVVSATLAGPVKLKATFKK